MQLKAIIVDDERAARNVLTNLLRLGHANVEVVDACASVDEAVISIQKHQPQVVFLDVEMPQYAGYEIVKFFDRITFQIVFVTAYDKYAVKAFELNAADYLVKPIQRVRLSEAVERVEQRCMDQQQLVDYKSILKSMEREQAPVLSVSKSGQKILVKTTEIIAVKAHGSYCEIILDSGETHLLSKNIGWIEKELQADSSLFRSHKSWIINLRCVVAIQRNKEALVLKGGVQPKLSRFRKEAFKAAVEKINHRLV